MAWGINDHGEATTPSPNTGFIAISAGLYHNLALKSDGSVVVWGDNGVGQYNVPPPNADFVGIAAGWQYNLGLKTDGSVVSWGYNGDGRCTIPPPNTRFVAIAAGEHHGIGLKSPIVTGIDEHAMAGNASMAIIAVTPNPFRPTTWITFRSSNSQRLSLTIFDLSGRHLRTVFSEQAEPGIHRVQWDGCDSEGTQTASGIYWVRLQDQVGRSQDTKIVRMR